MAKPEIKLVVSIEAFAKLPTGGEAHLLVSSATMDGVATWESIVGATSEAYQDLRFLLRGGTGNPLDPWTLDQDEPVGPPQYCQCGQPCIEQNGEYRCLETGDPIDDCRDYVPF